MVEINLKQKSMISIKKSVFFRSVPFLIVDVLLLLELCEHANANPDIIRNTIHTASFIHYPAAAKSMKIDPWRPTTIDGILQQQSLLCNGVKSNELKQSPNRLSFTRSSSASELKLKSSLTSSTRLSMAFIGGQDNNNGNNNGSNNGSGGKNNNPMDDWLPDPSEKNEAESEAEQQTRQKRADSRLPINYRSDDGSREEEFETPDLSSSSALERLPSSGGDASSSSAIEKSKVNPYLQVVSSLSPSEIISRFTLTAHPRVQEAAKSTILGLIGALPKMAFETTVVTTGAKLASLMFQLQMTGYMFKNAEYRMALSREFGNNSASGFLLKGSNDSDEEENEVKSVKGKIRVNLNPSTSSQTNDSDNDSNDNDYTLEVDASAFTSELRSEVSRLKEELSALRSAKDESIRKDLLTYIRTLPPMELQKLSSTMSDDVLTAMKGLVSAVMAGIDADAIRQNVEDEASNDEDDDTIDEGRGVMSPNTIMEQSGEAIAQLCMWQLVVGYNLRELEVREEMKGTLLGGDTTSTTSSVDNNDNIDDDSFSPGLQPGGME